MMNQIFYSLIIVLTIINLSCILIRVDASKCGTCKDIVKRFKEGLENTAKSNFGGGNTNWEERKLGSFANSETRFLEVLEHSCEDGKKECYHMLEEYEEVLEQWYFLEYSRGTDKDLQEFFCIEKLQVCCPDGTYGPRCDECPGGKDRPCSGNGKCEGDGTREGDGTCSCYDAHSGVLCSECNGSYYEQARNDSHIVCQPCHVACNKSCTGPERIHCGGCAPGWQSDQEEGCLDVDECSSGSASCSESQYCLNSEGSYHCNECDIGCNGCTAHGVHNCKACSERHFLQEGVCTRCHMSCAKSCADATPSTCDSCADGWRLAEDNTCTDVDECAYKSRVCEDSMFCINTQGSSFCSSCHMSCLECSGPTPADCAKCKTGYVWDAEVNECTDVDECVDDKLCASPGEKCINTIGTYRCECADGFVRKNRKCEPKKKSSVVKKDKPKTTKRKGDKSQSSLPEDLGTPAKVSPIDEEMVVMEGQLNLPTQSDIRSANNDSPNLQDKEDL